MPIGVIINALAIFIGGIAGTLAGNRLTTDFKENINMIFGVCAMGMGINAIVLMENMPAVILALIAGTALGLVIHVGKGVAAAAELMQRAVTNVLKTPAAGLSQDEFTSTLMTVIVLFCASGTGIYGSIVSGMTGEHSILIAKSILDLFTALIFACSLGMVVSLIAIPQAVIFLLLFFGAQLIFPLTTPAMINDFKAAGGFLLLAIGFRMIKVKMFPTADMIPVMVLVMPLSWLWVTYILPFVS